MSELKPVFSVHELNGYIDLMLGYDPNLKDLAVEGELEAVKRHSSGHMYFTLKDEVASVNCVMFRQYVMGLRFLPKDGQRVRLVGRASLYQRDGRFQLMATGLMPKGDGSLYAAFAAYKEELKQRGYQYCHVEGPDKRGIDCALLYNPKMFQVKTVKLVPYIPTEKQDSGFTTRGFLTVSGTLAGEPVSFIVCHLPSRFNGSYYREVGAAQAKAVKDSLLRLDKDAKVFIMGDMNDDPTNKSMHEVLGGKEEISLEPL